MIAEILLERGKQAPKQELKYSSDTVIEKLRRCTELLKSVIISQPVNLVYSECSCTIHTPGMLVQLVAVLASINHPQIQMLLLLPKPLPIILL